MRSEKCNQKEIPECIPSLAGVGRYRSARARHTIMNNHMDMIKLHAAKVTCANVKSSASILVRQDCRRRLSHAVQFKYHNIEW